MCLVVIGQRGRRIWKIPDVGPIVDPIGFMVFVGFRFWKEGLVVMNFYDPRPPFL